MKIFILSLCLLTLNFTVSAQSKVVPIVEMKIGALLGGVENGKFLDAKTTVSKLIAEQNYTLFLFDGTNASLKLKKPIDRGGVCEEFFSLEENEEDAEKRFEKGGVALGEGFGWNPLPRSSKTVDLNNAEYRKIFNDYLRTKRITKPELKLNQAVRVDLEGDGKEEVLLAATRIIGYDDRKQGAVYDEYSVILLRKIIGGKPRTILVAGEFRPKSKYEYDGSNYTISSILDLNGDKKMELVIYSQYYEGNSTEVFEMIGNKAVEVKTLTVDCGV